VKEGLLRLVALVLGHGAPLRDRRGVAPTERLGAKPCGGTCLRTQGVSGGASTTARSESRLHARETRRSRAGSQRLEPGPQAGNLMPYRRIVVREPEAHPSAAERERDRPRGVTAEVVGGVHRQLVLRLETDSSSEEVWRWSPGRR
jgi:hypothetical protein